MRGRSGRRRWKRGLGEQGKARGRVLPETLCSLHRPARRFHCGAPGSLEPPSAAGARAPPSPRQVPNLGKLFNPFGTAAVLWTRTGKGKVGDPGSGSFGSFQAFSKLR